MWRVISFPLFVLLGILGFGSPVFFSAVSDESLKDVGKKQDLRGNGASIEAK